MLSDPKRRAEYDKFGVSATQGMNIIDPSLFFMMLYGSEQLEPYIGGRAGKGVWQKKAVLGRRPALSEGVARLTRCGNFLLFAGKLMVANVVELLSEGEVVEAVSSVRRCLCRQRPFQFSVQKATAEEAVSGCVLSLRGICRR